MKKNPQAKKEVEDFKDKYLRALADYHNLEKRVSREKEEVAHQTKKNVILRILPFLDNLEKAEIFVKDEGLKLVKDQLLQTLAEEGLEEVALEGLPFDPELAEAVEVVAGEADNIIKEVVRRGFRLHGKVIRPAQVKVTRNPK